MLGLSEQEWRLVGDMLVKLSVSALLAGLIGWERELHGRPAGIRTHMLLIIGVVLFTEASKHFASSEESRVAAQVVVGVGFLGAGTIIRTGPEIKGLTTAASIWATSGIGMAVSLGGPFMAIAVIGTLFTLFILSVVDVFEDRFVRSKQPQTVRITLAERAALFAPLEHISTRTGVRVRSVTVVQSSPDVVVDVQVSGRLTGIVESVLPLPGVVSASMEPV